MRLETLFEKFETIADMPDGIARLRELILEEAIRGKLVPQDSTPAQGTPLLTPLELAEDEAYLQIPSGWIWTRVGDTGRIFNGVSVSERVKQELSKVADGLPFIATKDVGYGRHELAYENGLKVPIGDPRFKVAHTNSVLICAEGGSAGKKIGITLRDICFGNKLFANETGVGVDPLYIFYLYQTRTFYQQFSRRMTGIIGGISRGEFVSIPIPLPPQSEQQRIVAKVDELMAVCDQLEAEQKDRDRKRVDLSRAALARFAEAPTPVNLEFIFHKSYDIPPADLRKTILTLAVQGKLVPQDPNDEPAQELIARIAKMRLAKKVKDSEPVSAEEAPNEVPYSWAWVRLGNISLTSDSGWSPQCMPVARSGTEWGVLKVSAVSWGVFKPEENKALPPGMTGRPDCEVKAGDFLLSRANTEELVARSVVVEQTPPHLMMSDKLVRFTFPYEIERNFVNLANTSEPSRAYYARNASGTSSSMKNIGREVICSLPIPFHPSPNNAGSWPK
jgi:type I restriction enzyme S subunit